MNNSKMEDGGQNGDRSSVLRPTFWFQFAGRSPLPHFSSHVIVFFICFNGRFTGNAATFFKSFARRARVFLVLVNQIHPVLRNAHFNSFTAFSNPVFAGFCSSFNDVVLANDGLFWSVDCGVSSVHLVALFYYTACRIDDGN